MRCDFCGVDLEGKSRWLHHESGLHKPKVTIHCCGSEQCINQMNEARKMPKKKRQAQGQCLLT